MIWPSAIFKDHIFETKIHYFFKKYTPLNVDHLNSCFYASTTLNVKTLKVRYRANILYVCEVMGKSAVAHPPARGKRPYVYM